MSPISPTCAGIKSEFNYTDTLNRVWLEAELILQAEAKALAIAYWENIKALAEVECDITVQVLSTASLKEI